MSWKVGCIQMDIEFGHPEKNIQAAEKWLEKAAGEGCTTAVLPELWTTGYDLTRLDEIAHDQGRDVKEFLAQQAKKHQMNIVGGSVANRVDDGVKNTMYIFDKEGNLVHEYSKLHLFQLMDEHLHLLAGDDETKFTLENQEAGSFICYDLRFPEWFRKPVLQGAKALFVVAEWPAPRVGHWRTLLTARAIENQCYIIACNRVGSDPNNEFAGHSMIIDPWGEVLAEAGEKEELLVSDVKVEEIDEIRSRIPIFDDRRPAYY